MIRVISNYDDNDAPKKKKIKIKLIYKRHLQNRPTNSKTKLNHPTNRSTLQIERHTPNTFYFYPNIHKDLSNERVVRVQVCTRMDAYL